MKILATAALLMALFAMSGFALADVATGEVGTGAGPGDQLPKICIKHRDVVIGDDANPPGINPFDYRTSLYAFTGEQITYTVIARDPNGALDIGYAYMGVATGTTDFENRILLGADRLVALQNTDGGWDWFISETESTTNTLGVTANGVLRAYQLTHNPLYLASLDNAYNYALATVPGFTGQTETTLGVDSCPDITWLVETSEATRDVKYANLAKQRYDTKVSVMGSAQAWAEYIRDARIGQGYPNGIIPWDVDKCVKAAKALNRYFSGHGYGADAASMAEVIYSVIYGGSAIFNASDTATQWYTLGLTGGVNAFWSTGLHAAEYTDLKAKLVAYQNAGGSWPSEDGYPVDVQSTAYSVVEAIRTGLTGPGIDGAFWLSLEQLPTGGWTGLNSVDEEEENNEVTGESIDALYAAHGLTIPDLQFQPAVICEEVPLITSGTELRDKCDGFGFANADTDKKFECTYTVEPFRVGEKVVMLLVGDASYVLTGATHTENWYFNPSISMSVTTSDGMPVTFESMPYGADDASERTVHSLNKIKVKNTADGGVNMWMWVAGTDLYASQGPATCYDPVAGTSTNHIAIENYMWYRGWSGTQWTSWEGWEQMSKYNQNDGCEIPVSGDYSAGAPTCYGALPVPFPNTNDNIPDALEHVLTNQGTMEMEFKLQYPMPCQGVFDQGTVYVFGKAV